MIDKRLVPVFSNFFLIFNIFLLFIPFVFSQEFGIDEAVTSTIEYESDLILINSRNWMDVYSAMLFSELIRKDFEFITSQRHAIVQVDIIPVTKKDIVILESTSDRYYVGLEGLTQSKGFSSETITFDRPFNLILGDMLDIGSFIVVGDSYGYNSVSVTPYALLTNSYVVFANKFNIADVKKFLSDKAEKVTIYGLVDPEVKEELTSFNPYIIDKGSRIENNLAIVEEFLSLQEISQAWIVSGDELVKPIFSNRFPVMFIGKTNVPQSIETFILENDINSLVLLGNDLAPMVDNFRRQFEATNGRDLKVTVLIGRSARKIDFSGDSIEAIDMFRLPVPKIGLEVSNLLYNQLTDQLEVTYVNAQASPLYFMSTVEIEAGGDRVTVGDESPYLLSSRKSKTLTYPLSIERADISGIISVVFGEDIMTLDNLYTYGFDALEFIEIIDSSEIAIPWVRYDRLNHAIYIHIDNVGEASAYVDLELDMRIDGVNQTLYGQEIYRLAEGESLDAVIRQRLTSLDLEDNPSVLVRAAYSQREDSLSKRYEMHLPLGRTVPGTVYLITGAAIVILLIIIILVRRKEKKHI